ncbi:rod shape-determining protein MreD [Aequorivita sp. H23M31]|uniref:Rod shape-determining protein MreD n=1 Tax=Aequorivita ciconiae TaxID=2494375 RepID=A0A410G2Z0_9FLAO|nr:rod shape-determining protein MreD [Aequorivita sp. H23M31]
MQTKEILINCARFIILVFLQVFLLNNINLLGYINPYLYILFILLYPSTGNQTLLIFLSFLLGLSVDIFEDSGGVHAAACAFIAYIRPVVLKYSFGISYEYNSVKIERAAPTEKFIYVASIIVIHNFIMFALEIFSFDHILLLLKSTLFSGIFTFILIMGSLILINKKVK